MIAKKASRMIMPDRLTNDNQVGASMAFNVDFYDVEKH